MGQWCEIVGLLQTGDIMQLWDGNGNGNGDKQQPSGGLLPMEQRPGDIMLRVRFVQSRGARKHKKRLA